MQSDFIFLKNKIVQTKTLLNQYVIIMTNISKAKLSNKDHFSVVIALCRKHRINKAISEVNTVLLRS